MYVSVFPKFVDLISTMYRFTMIYGTFVLDTGLPVTCLVTKVSNLSALILYIYIAYFRSVRFRENLFLPPKNDRNKEESSGKCFHVVSYS